MSELRVAIDWMAKWSFVEDATKRDLVVEAARRLVKLEKSVDPVRLGDGLEFAHITDSDGHYLIYVAQQVKTALGVTTEDDG